MVYEDLQYKVLLLGDMQLCGNMFQIELNRSTRATEDVFLCTSCQIRLPHRLLPNAIQPKEPQLPENLVDTWMGGELPVCKCVCVYLCWTSVCLEQGAAQL